MSEHVHEWEWPDNLAIPHCKNRICNAILQPAEIVRRVNATESLGKTAAALAANMIREYAAGEDNEITNELFAYAAALEKD